MDNGLKSAEKTVEQVLDIFKNMGVHNDLKTRPKRMTSRT